MEIGEGVMSVQAVLLNEVYIVAPDETETPGIELSAVVPAPDLLGPAPLGLVDVDGLGAVSVVVVAYPAGDVDSLDLATVGAALIAALGAV